jgi:putative polyketide hydroxylase
VSRHGTQVLVVGGGVVGLSAALLLRLHGVECVLVERRRTPSVLPRARGFHARSSEIFRQLGIEERVRVASAGALQAGVFGGLRSGATVLSSTAHPIDRPFGTHVTDSPSAFCFLPQVDLEPILVDAARDRGAELRLGTTMTALRHHTDGVEALLSTADGNETVDADYVIAADGASSGIRGSLGIDCWELPPTHHYINVFLRSDLAELVAGRTFSQCHVANEAVRGLMLCKNNTDEWSFHIEYDPTAETLDDYPEPRCEKLIRAAIGVEVEVEVLARSAWNTGVQVANAYRAGRVFLAGDAAHRHAPFGGFGANTGIADAHNLVWKLAAVLDGRAATGLLDTYGVERRPRAVTGATQARLRTDVADRFRTPDPDATDDPLLDMDAVMTRFRYASDAVVEPRPVGGHVDVLRGQPGTRVPHVWLTRDEVSTLDCCGPGFTVFTDDERWREAASVAHRDTGWPVTVVDTAEVGETWRAATRLPTGGALLVRPDQHVAARSDRGLAPETLSGLLAAISGR